MRIAICFSGMIRTGVEASPNIKNFIGNLWDSCDFFMHTWDQNYHNVLTGETLEHYNRTNFTKTLNANKFVSMKDIYKFKNFSLESYNPTMETIGRLFFNYIKSDGWIIPWFYSWHKSIILKRCYEDRYKFKYDIVVKMRPDILFNPSLKLEDCIEQVSSSEFGINTIYHDTTVNNITADDIFFVSNSKNMDDVSDWWIDRLVTKEYLDTSIPTFNHFYNYIVKKGITPKDLQLPYIGDHYKISLFRQECTMFDPINEFEKCVECDRTHYHTLKTSKIKSMSDTEINKMVENTLDRRKIFPNHDK